MITYRRVREWVCPMCGGMNLTPESDIEEEDVMVCWKCTEEYYQFTEEVENAE